VASRAAALHPTSADALSAAGTALAADGRYPEARQKLDLALVLNPSHIPTLLSYGSVLENQGGGDEAVEKMYHQACMADPEAPLPLVEYAALLQRRLALRSEDTPEDHDVILKLLQSAIELDPHDPDALTSSAAMIIQSTQSTQMMLIHSTLEGSVPEEFLRRACELAPHHVPAAATLAQLLAARARGGEVPAIPPIHIS
ncbi:hypothetical protein T484DRAFT_1786598, partial [Baffinella frigidus]